MHKRYWSVGIPIFLLALNLFVIWPWFQAGFTPHPDSMEPAMIAQARFIRENWPDIAWQPEWYLGLPFRFLGSPFLPYFLALVNSILPIASLWLAYRVVTGIGMALIPLGVFFLVREFNRSTFNTPGVTRLLDRQEFREVSGLQGLLAALIFSLFPGLVFLFPQVFTIGRRLGWWPWQYISLALLGNGRKILGLAILPFCLLVINRFLKRELKGVFWPVFLVVLLALVDLPSITTLFVLSVLLVVSYMMVGKLKKKLKRITTIFLFAFGILSFYYTPRFWFQALSAPSLAGKGAFSVAAFIIRTFSILIPLGLGILSAKYVKKKNQIFIFFFLWIFVYGFLTLARFVADVDFWQDYTAWGIELMMGEALLLSYSLAKNFRFSDSLPTTSLPEGNKPQALFSKFISPIIIIFLSSLLWIGKRNKLLVPRLDISQTVEARVMQELKERVRPGERIFISGSPVFWLNALSNVAQARGGADQAANHPWWDHAAYQVRVGTDPDLAANWLQVLGVSWLVVHGPDSTEPYHDFVNLERFKNNPDLYQLVWDENDDWIYQVSGNMVREINDPEAFLKLPELQDGADRAALTNYQQLLGNMIPFEWVSASELVIREPGTEAISLAITYDPGWQATQSSADNTCQRLEITRDRLGQIVVFPKNKSQVNLKYQSPWLDKLGGAVIGLIMLVYLFQSQKKTAKSN